MKVSHVLYKPNKPGFFTTLTQQSKKYYNWVLTMTTNEELTSMLMKDYVTTDDEIDQQLTALRDMLKLPPEQRQAILVEHAAKLAEYFVPGSEEMEWAEEYVEDENWDDE
jgi:hypothetical protein